MYHKLVLDMDTHNKHGHFNTFNPFFLPILTVRIRVPEDVSGAGSMGKGLVSGGGSLFAAGFGLVGVGVVVVILHT